MRYKHESSWMFNQMVWDHMNNQAGRNHRRAMQALLGFFVDIGAEQKIDPRGYIRIYSNKLRHQQVTNMVAKASADACVWMTSLKKATAKKSIDGMLAAQAVMFFCRCLGGCPIELLEDE